MATALTFYATTSNYEDTSTNGYIGECSTSTSTTGGSSAYSGTAARSTSPAGWYSVPLTSATGGAGGTTLTPQPAFGTGSAAGKPNGTAFKPGGGKRIPAGTWTIDGIFETGGHSASGTLHIRVGTRTGSTFTQYGSDITVAITADPQDDFTATGTIPAITLPTATTWLYIDATIHGGEGFLVGTDGAQFALGQAHFKVVTPGIETLPGVASFVGSGVFSAQGVVAGRATFVGSGVFGLAAYNGAATFVGSGILSAQGRAYAPSKTGMPAISVQLALTGTCWAGSNWTTIGPLTNGVTTGYGRQHQLQRVEPAQVGITLYNRDGSFNPWSKNSRFYNQLSATDSNPTAGTGTWATAGNSTVTRSIAQALFGSWSFTLTATAAGNAFAATGRYTATAKRTYSAVCSFRVKTSGNDFVRCSIVWLNATGNEISQSDAPFVTDTTTGWTQVRARGTAPTGAVKFYLQVLAGTAHVGEAHYFACAGVFDVTFSVPIAASQAWCVGQQAPLWPGQPFRIVANWQTTTYVVAAGVIESWVPKYKTVAGDIVVSASDLLSILATTPVPESSYVAVVQETDPVLFWTMATTSGTNVLDSSGNGHTGTASATYLTFNGTPLVTKTSAESAAFHLEHGHTETGTITASLTQPVAWSVEMVLEFSATNDQPTLESTAMEVSVFSWGSGATRTNLMVVQAKTGANTLFVSKGTASASISTSLTSGAHHVVVTRASSGTTQLFLNGSIIDNATISLSARDATFKLGGLSSTYLTGRLYVQDVSVYDAVLTDTQISVHYHAYKTGLTNLKSGAMIKTLLLSCGIPSSALGTIDTGTIEVKPPDITTGETQLLSVLQTIDNTEQGLFFAAPTGKLRFYSRAYISSSPTSTTAQAVVSNDATPDHVAPAVPIVPARDKTTLFNYCAVGLEGATATGATVTVKVASTAKSIAKYGARMMTGFIGMYFAEAETAQILAELMVSRFASPQTRVRAVQLSSVTERGSYLPQMLGLKLLDAIEVRWQPTDGSDSPFVQTAQIEQITHTVTKTRWDTTFVLAMPL